MNDDELLKAAYTKGAQLVALYEKYAAIDLKITYDYDGGYAQGFYSYEDKEKLMPEFLTDLYNFMVEKNAFQLQEQPTLETFLDLSWWSNYSKFEATDLSAILFTPYMDSDGNVHEDYMGINEEYGTFFNDPRYNKWVVLMDFVNEATQAGNMSGQDAWGRSGLLYAQYKYANVYKPELANADLTKYAGNEVYVTNKGTALGAYRFAQYVLGNIGSANHKYYIPHNYFSTIFDRQTTQERYGEQIYHCTDLTVKLYDDPYKEGYVFDGWYFVKEDGSLGDKAVVTGSLFKDLQVKAKWLSALESKVEEAVGRELTPIYYPTDPNNGGQYRSKYDGGTLSTQEAQVGIGIVGIVVGDNLFVMPKYALILLGQSATADYTIEVKNEETCPYGIDEAQDSTGIVLKPEGPTKQNSYGHGALYFNVSQFNITLADVTKTTYGRNLNGTGYGYDRFLFTPQEDGTYKAVLIGSAVGTALTLKPGEFLWCPMTAERWSVPLTDCDGTNGTVGVLSDGLTVQILNISEFTPAPSKPWTATKFYDGDELIGQFYLEEGESFTVPTPEAKIGFDFVGWATKPDASAEEVVTQISLVPTESVTYYAIYIEVSRFDELIINPGYEGTDPNVFKTFEEAFKHTNDNCVIKLVAGIYNESFTITTPMTIQGPNADLRGYWTRGDEATLTGAITINSDNVTLKGLHFGGDDSVYVTDAYNNPGTAARKLLTKNGINGFTFENNVVTAGRIFLSMAANTNTVIKNNFFNWTAETAKAYTYWRPIRMDGLSTDYSFVGNKVVQSVQNSGNSGFYDLLYFADLGGKLLIEGNDICMSTYNWMFNGAKGSAATEINVYNNTFSSAIPGSDDNAGWAFEALAEACVCRVIGNTFEGVAGTTFSYKTVKHLEVIANEFLQATYKPRINAEIGDGFVYNTNYVKADAVTAVSGYLAVAKDTATQDEAIAARRARFGVRTLEETWEVLFTDFAAFAGAADVATFKADYIAKTGTYDSAKELYTANKQGVIDDTLGTFAHSSTYGPKYLPFVDALDAYVNNVNDTQHAWSSTWTGLLRFREYLQGNEARVTDYRSQLLIDGLTEGYRQAALAAKAAAAASGTKVGEITLECKGLSMWTADYYGNYVYLFDGYKSGTYWGGIYLNKVYGNVYEVIATKVSGGAAGISACDVSIIYAENNATDYAAINAMGVQVGDLVSFDTDPVALENAKAFEAPLPVATVYRG